MARRQDYNGQAKTIAATSVQTLSWTQSEIASAGVVAYHVVMTGANNDLGAITRIRLTANGQSIFDLTPAQLIAYANFYSGGEILMSTADSRFTIPLAMLQAFGPDRQDVCQFPAGAQVQLDITTDNSTSAGNAFVGWTETNIDAQLYPRLLSSQMNIGASVALGRFNFGETGNVRGLFLPHTGLQTLRAYIGGREVFEGPGPDFLGATTGDMLAEFARLYGAGQDPAVPFLPVTINEPAPITSSYVELQTGSGWGGTGNELTVYATAPNVPGVAA